MIEEFGEPIPLDAADGARVPIESREHGTCLVRDLIGGLMAAITAEVARQLAGAERFHVVKAIDARPAPDDPDIIDVHVRFRLAPDYLHTFLVPREDICRAEKPGLDGSNAAG